MSNGWSGYAKYRKWRAAGMRARKAKYGKPKCTSAEAEETRAALRQWIQDRHRKPEPFKAPPAANDAEFRKFNIDKYFAGVWDPYDYD